MSKFAPLLEPITLSNGITLANRFVLSPMTTNSSTKEGHITGKTYVMRNVVPIDRITSNWRTYIEPYGQLFEYGFNISDDACIPGLRKVAQAMKQGE